MEDLCLTVFLLVCVMISIIYVLYDRDRFINGYNICYRYHYHDHSEVIINPNDIQNHVIELNRQEANCVTYASVAPVGIRAFMQLQNSWLQSVGGWKHYAESTRASFRVMSGFQLSPMVSTYF